MKNKKLKSHVSKIKDSTEVEDFFSSTNFFSSINFTGSRLLC